MSDDLYWDKEEEGWYWLRSQAKQAGLPRPLAAVCLEKHNPPWCVYIEEYAPPGDAQFRTLKEAQRWAEKKVEGA